MATCGPGEDVLQLIDEDYTCSAEDQLLPCSTDSDDPDSALHANCGNLRPRALGGLPMPAAPPPTFGDFVVAQAGVVDESLDACVLFSMSDVCRLSGLGSAPPRRAPSRRMPLFFNFRSWMFLS